MPAAKGHGAEPSRTARSWPSLHPKPQTLTAYGTAPRTCGRGTGVWTPPARGRGGQFMNAQSASPTRGRSCPGRSWGARSLVVPASPAPGRGHEAQCLRKSRFLPGNRDSGGRPRPPHLSCSLTRRREPAAPESQLGPGRPQRAKVTSEGGRSHTGHPVSVTAPSRWTGASHHACLRHPSPRTRKPCTWGLAGALSGQTHGDRHVRPCEHALLSLAGGGGVGG